MLFTTYENCFYTSIIIIGKDMAKVGDADIITKQFELTSEVNYCWSFFFLIKTSLLHSGNR